MGFILGRLRSTSIRPLQLPMSQRIDLTGQRFGSLTVQEWVPGALRDGAWRCACACGGAHLASGSHLRRGVVLSCGCLRPKHGGKGTAAYRAWQSMLRRCTDSGHKDWPDYGGRGITVCDRWRSFSAFLADMGQPASGATIERCDNARGYEPGNCEWASRKAQARNTRRNIVIEYRGRSQCLAAWADELGVNYWKLHSRHKAGWSAERMFADLQ